jgi:transcriptional regulator with XRE-family HTH domain
MAPTPSDASAEAACTAYNAQFHPTVAEKLYKLGLTQSDVAEAFGASLEEISDWERDHVEFYDACERGRSAASNEVNRALHKCATGYVECGEKLMKVDGELVVVPYRRQVPPSAAAIRLVKAKAARDGYDENLGDFWQGSRPENTFDTIAKNEKRRKMGNRADD